MQIIPISAFNDNYIWAIKVQNKLVVVDPGDAKPVLAYIQQHHLTLAAVLITHHHADHTGGIHALQQHCNAQLPVYGPATEHINGVTHPITDERTVNLTSPALTFTVLSVPGHTRGHLAYYCAPALFCGDTIFSAGCGRLFEGTPEQMYDSLQQINALPANTQLYPAHEYTLSNLAFAHAVEPENTQIVERTQQAEYLLSDDRPTLPTQLAEERTFNPFLRVEQAAIRQQLEKQYKIEVESPVHAFSLLRQWKDTF